MSWNIGLFYNNLKIPQNLQEDLEALAEEYYHCIYFGDDGLLCFDGDAMEHQDFLHEEWFRNFAQEHAISGSVVWGSVEGDNRGQLWGYNFWHGNYDRLNMKESLKFLLELEDSKS